MSGIFRVSRNPNGDGGHLVGADSEEHALALARYQWSQAGRTTGWPFNDEPVYVTRMDDDGAKKSQGQTTKGDPT